MNEAAYFDKFENFMSSFMRMTHLGEVEDLSKLNLTIHQCVVLEQIRKNPNLNMTDLAQLLNVTLGNATIMVDKLVKESYVERVADPDDRRVVRLGLTAAGSDAAKFLMNHKRKSLQKFFNILSKDEKENLLKIMEKVSKHIEKEKA